MTNIRFKYDSTSGKIEGFFASNHAGFSSSGKDIVCAGVSALVFTSLIGLEQVAKLDSFYSTSKVKINCEVPCEASQESKEKANTILETLRLGLIELEKQYPKFVKVIDEGGANLD